jgi:hypothetical protein
MLEIAAIAGSVVMRFLVPFLTKGAAGFSDELQKQTSKVAADKVVEASSGLWDRIKGAFTSHDDAQALDLFQKNPQQWKQGIEQMLVSQMERDEKFREDLNALLQQPTADGSTVYNVTGKIVGFIDARGATISGGEMTGVKVEGAAADGPRESRSP